MTKKVLLFYISRFSGHFQAAMAIESALLGIDGDINTEIVNAFEYTNPVLGKIITKTYLEVVKNKPQIWGNIYDNPAILETVKKAREALHKYNSPKMRKLLDSARPDIVYCTQAFPCGMVAEYKRVTGKQVPLVAVLTDYAPHSYWIFDEVDCYCVPSEHIKEILIGKGVDGKRIKVLGIPIYPKFAERRERKDILEEYKLSSDKHIVLVMGGSQGLGEIDKIVKTILKCDMSEFFFIVIAGMNKKLYAKMIKETKNAQGFIKVFKYVEDVDRLMEIADLIITKAGGITTAEALAKGLPMLIVNPIPGQERMNADYLVGKGAAIEIKDLNIIDGAVRDLFSTKGTLVEMRKNASSLSKGDSAVKIAKLFTEGF